MLKRPFNPKGKACLSLSLCERWADQLLTGDFQSHTMNNPEVIAEWQRRQNKAKKQSISTFFELKKSAGSPFEEERNRWYRVRCPQGSAKLKTAQTKLSQTAPQYNRRQARWKERKRMGLRRKKKSYVGSVLACLSVSVQSEQEMLELFMKMPALSVSGCSGRNKGEMQTGIACLLKTPSFSPCQLWLSHSFQDACGRLFFTFLGVIFIYIPHYALLFVHRALIILRQDEHKQMTLSFDSVHVQFIVEP